MVGIDCVILCQSAIVRGLSKKQYNVLLDVSSKVNNLRNCAVEKTYLVKLSNDKHYKKINFQSVISKVKKEYNYEYSLVQAHIANATIKKHVESFNSFVELKNKSIDKKYNRPVHKPKKHNDHLHNIIIPKEFITSSKKKLKEGYIELPLSREYKKTSESKESRPRIKIPENIQDKKIMMVEIIPINNGRMFKANFIYELKKEPLN